MRNVCCVLLVACFCLTGCTVLERLQDEIAPVIEVLSEPLGEGQPSLIGLGIEHGPVIVEAVESGDNGNVGIAVGTAVLALGGAALALWKRKKKATQTPD